MSYSIGQFRRTQVADDGFLSAIAGKTVDAYNNKTNRYEYQSAFTLGGDNSTDESDTSTINIYFVDPAIDITTATEQQLSSDNCYYLNFTVSAIDGATTGQASFVVFLANLDNDSSSATRQDIKEFTATVGGNQTYELIFKPNGNYQYIVFSLVRSIEDFNVTDEETEAVTGRNLGITINDLKIVNNLLGTTAFSGASSLKKIGIQGPPGMMFVLDGEEMRIGRTGIYELYRDDITINYLGFVVNEALFTQNGGLDFFVVDYRY